MKLIRLPDVLTMTGRGRSSIYDMIARGEFPRPVNIGPAAVAWVESEVVAWIEDRIAERDRTVAA